MTKLSPTLLISAASLAFSAPFVSAQVINDDGQGRYGVTNFLTTPTFTSGSWGPGSQTLFGAPGGATNTWFQFVQFNLTGNEAALNNATSVTLSLGNGLSTGASTFNVFYSFGAVNLAGASSGANMINNNGVALGGTSLSNSRTATGSLSISMTSILDVADLSANKYLYITLRPTAAFSSVNADLSGSTLTAVPEPSSAAMLAGLGALGLVGLRRRRR